jgi:muconolactone delta-isomerase
MAQFMALLRRDYDRFSEAAFTAELLEAEAERARELHAQGVYRTLWGRKDAPGAVTLIEADSLDEALAAIESLPLRQKQMLLLEVIIPLVPYRGFGPRG